MKQHHLAASLFAIAAIFCGCSEDSNGSNEPQPQAGCTSNEDCQSGKCLESGECAQVVELGAACDDAHLCKAPLVCENGTCAEKKIDNPPVSEDDCTSTQDCNGSRVCKNSKCVDVVTHGRNEACDPDDESIVCQNDLTCFNKKCMTQEDISSMEKCQSDDDCVAEDTYKNCLPDGVCGLYLEKGEDCTLDPKTICKDDMSCLGICIQEVSEGERCALTEGTDCASDLNCVNEICRKVDNSVEVGKTCNDGWLFCAQPAVCRDDVCVSVAKEDEACDEKAHIVCADGLQCVNSVCTPVGKTCTSSKDCLEKDSFCCLEDECGAKGRCIPYDEKNSYDKACQYATKPGIFEAQVQCRWQPPASDAKHKNSNKVEIPPLVGRFGEYKDAKGKALDTVIAFWSFNARCFEASFPSNVTDDSHDSVIRFINPETCETLETVELKMPCSYYNNPAAVDIDGDGILEIIVIDKTMHSVMFAWDKQEHKYVQKWRNDNVTGGTVPMVFDLDNDTIPEVVLGRAVVNAQTGERIVAGDKVYEFAMSAIGYLFDSGDDAASMVLEDKVYHWNATDKKWDQIAKLPTVRPFAAYADFGTPGATPSDFDFTKLDGIPEIVSSGVVGSSGHSCSAGNAGGLNIYALVPSQNGSLKYDVQEVMSVSYTKPYNSTAGACGGPVTIGDFDSDGLPEVGVASSGYYGVYDPRCASYKAGECADKYVLWERWSQDLSSGKTGSSLFDFDGDGQVEAVYADECFTRIYDGKTGKVLFSAKRSSMTSIEAPVIADVDNDGSAEILMGSDVDMDCTDDSGKVVKPSNETSNHVDPIHEGIPCMDDEDCPSRKCDSTLKLCTCNEDKDCNVSSMQQYVCAPPIHPEVGMMKNIDNKGRKMIKEIGSRPDNWSEATGYKVCRATRKSKEQGWQDLMIFKDRLDRWVSSRPMWNQHAYNIINIQDDGKVPTRLEWVANWLAKLVVNKVETDRPRYNNYRMNRQGEYGAGYVPDITGRFIAGSICGTTTDGRHVISGKLCNRGTKPVSTNLPATFFRYDDSKADKRGKLICTSYTNTPVGVGECAQVGCTVSEAELKELKGQKVLMVSNLDENGFASTVECNSDNNTDVITVESCESKEIEIVN